jgi:lysyl-tRNA synthetase class II
MHLAEHKKNTFINSGTLSNIQMELIKLYSTNLDHHDLMEIKEILAKHFAQKAINEADNIRNRNKMSADTMENWLNGN